MLILKVDPALSQLGPAIELFTPGCSSTQHAAGFTENIIWHRIS